RKGQIVVLERSPVVFRRKLSEAGYVAAVEASHEADLQIAMVVESTPSGTALLGSSRQQVGFDRGIDLSVAGAIARRAARFSPVLIGAGRPELRRSPSGQPRGLYCGIGVCQECRVLVDGVGVVRACVTPVTAGMTVSTGYT